jgi:uncharacterized protein YjiS (DUF1127 family)
VINTFARFCREADKQQRRKPIDPRIVRARRLLDEEVSLEATWHNGRAAEATVEALMFSLRNGIAALSKLDTLRRLSELSDAQLRDVAVRLQKFKVEIAKPWSSADVEVLLATRNKVRG